MTAPAVALSPAPALCRGREAFADEAEALAYARERGITYNRKLGCYSCVDCGGVHLERRRWLR